MTNQTPSLKIGLLDNSYHSLKRGYEMWSQWKRSEDAWLLKESIIWVHHGIELVLKQLLVQTNEFLVFDDVNKAVERLRILRRTKGMENAGVLELFDYDDKVMSVGFRNLVERAAITLSIPELAENAPLRVKIDELTKYRNKVVHFSVELDIAVVANLLSEILDPLLSVLNREVEDSSFKNTAIPEIRKIAQPVQKFDEKIRLEIVNNAIKATLNAIPPKGNRKAGIVWQTIGSGLGLSVISYLAQTRILPKIQDNHVIVVADRADLATQIYQQISDLASHDSKVKISFPESKAALAETLESKEPTIIVSTIQKFDPGSIVTNKECLLVGYNLHESSERLSATFPNAIYILFTNTPPQRDSTSRLFFGDIVGKYDFKQAIDNGAAKPVKIENRRIEVMADHASYKREYPELYLATSFSKLLISNEFIDELAQDIAEHFETRQKNWTGKGLIVVPDIKTGVALFQQMIEIKPNWHGDTDSTGSVKTISTTVSSKQRATLVERFRERDDSLSLLIATGSFIIGLSNPIIHTIYVTNPVSLQLRYILAGLVSRLYKDKEDGLIVDYVGLNWDLE
jgi:superfamily II DNA or RNA helicase